MKHLYDDFWEAKGVRIIECKTCGFKHIYPFIPKAEVAKLYELDYYTTIKPFDYDQVDEDYVRQALLRIQEDAFLNTMFDFVVQNKKLL